MVPGLREGDARLVALRGRASVGDAEIENDDPDRHTDGDEPKHHAGHPAIALESIGIVPTRGFFLRGAKVTARVSTASAPAIAHATPGEIGGATSASTGCSDHTQSLANGLATARASGSTWAWASR